MCNAWLSPLWTSPLLCCLKRFAKNRPHSDSKHLYASYKYDIVPWLYQHPRSQSIHNTHIILYFTIPKHLKFIKNDIVIIFGYSAGIVAFEVYFRVRTVLFAHYRTVTAQPMYTYINVLQHVALLNYCWSKLNEIFAPDWYLPIVVILVLCLSSSSKLDR